MRVGVYIGAVLGTLCLFLSLLFGSATQAALAATACALVVIPYALFRVGQADVEKRRHRELLDALSMKKQE